MKRNQILKVFDLQSSIEVFVLFVAVWVQSGVNNYQPQREGMHASKYGNTMVPS